MARFGTGAVITCCLTLAMLAPAYGERDFSYWNEEAIEGKLSDDWTAEIAVKYRFDDDAQRHYYTSTDIEASYAFTDWLEGGVGYREVYTAKAPSWKQENRRYAHGSVKWRMGDWKWKNTLKLEYRMKQDAEAFYRLREKLTLAAPWKFTALGINPYAADEVFLAEGEGLNQNRSFIGAVMGLTERITLDVYYMREIEKNDGLWDSRTDVIGTKVKVKF